MSAARIGKITMKGGGAEVRVIHQEKRDAGGKENWQGRIIDGARKIADHSEPGSELVGYFIIGLYSDGAASAGWRYDANRSPIPRALMPSYVAEIVRRDMITEVEAVAVVNRANGHEEP